MSYELQQAGRVVLGSLMMALAGWLIMRKNFIARPQVEYLKIKHSARPRRAKRMKP